MSDEARAAAGNISRARSVRGRKWRTGITNICRQPEFRPQAKAKNSPTRMRQRNRSVITHPHLLGDDVEVPCADGTERRYVNLDYAASTPVMAAVWDVVEAFVPWYSSVHRGTGAKSQVSTAAYERRARGRRAASSARATATRRLRPQHHRGDQRPRHRAAAGHAGALDAGRAPREHAALAPPRPAAAAVHAPRADELLEAAPSALPKSARIDLLAVTGASNVTGEVWPLAQLAALAHDHGAQLFVDAAQLAPHRAIDMEPTGIDHLALSGHKLYAPFGAGALVSRTRSSRRPAAARRRRDQARHARRRDLGRGARPLRGRLAERDRRRRARRRLRGARGDRHGRDRRPRARARRPPARRPGRRSTACTPLALWPGARRPRRRRHASRSKGYRPTRSRPRS